MYMERIELQAYCAPLHFINIKIDFEIKLKKTKEKTKQFIAFGKISISFEWFMET